MPTNKNNPAGTKLPGYVTFTILDRVQYNAKTNIFQE
jgi:hypothetical protein